MKRMVLIPEEKLLQYEQQQQQKSNVLHDVPNNQYGWGEEEEKKELSDDIIVRGIPKTMRTRAIALLERLKARPDVISWDDMGQVKIDGVFIPKSNISDLVSSAMRSRKYFDPVASQEFFNVLSNINVPKDLVRNEEGWKKVTQKGKGEDWGEVWDFVNPLFGGGKGHGKRKKPEEGYTQKGKGELSDDFSEAWYHLKKTSWKGIGRGKRKRPTTPGQKGGSTFSYLHSGNSPVFPSAFTPVMGFHPNSRGWYGIGKKRWAPQKGSGKLRKIPNWECYKG